MIVHLLESTLLLALALVFARLPLLAARTRYAVVFAALMKFAMPSAIVPRILAYFGLDLVGMTKGTIIINALGPLDATNLPMSKASLWPAIAIAIWALVAIALFARALLRGRNAIRATRSDAHVADARDLAALHRAQLRAGVTRTVRLIRSHAAITPSTCGVLHPIIVIPSRTELADDELETILAHECAHIARHDNLLNIIESIAGCALWFHPLVWIAQRMLDAAREEACDAIVVSSGNPNVYLTALGKVCGASIAPNFAGVSCIVSNTIRERMEAIMSFGKRRTLPHRAVTATALAFLVVATFGAGAARAVPASDDTSTSKYRVVVTATRQESPDLFVFHFEVHDRKSGVVLTSAQLRSEPESWATAVNNSDHETRVRMIGHVDGTAEAEVTVDSEPPIKFKLVAKKPQAMKKSEGISIDLKDADIRDLLKTFAQLINTEIVVDDDVSGRTSVTMRDVPWTEALEIIFRTNNLRSERIGNTIYVHRK
jgi:beta-lactamase regulating signal transducer with metallopeptidase domain